MNWVKKITFVYPYFSNVATLASWKQRNQGTRDSHVIKLMANDWKEWISLLSCEPSLIAVTFIFLSFFHCFVLFCFFFIIFRVDTSLFLFNLIFENLILHIFFLLMLIIPCSGMFWDVPECSMFLVLSMALIRWVTWSVMNVSRLIFLIIVTMLSNVDARQFRAKTTK